MAIGTHSSLGPDAVVPGSDGAGGFSFPSEVSYYIYTGILQENREGVTKWKLDNVAY
jgi:hypothetical protein